MAVCSICGKQLKILPDAEVNVLLGMLEKSNCGALYQLYPHIFEYCPDCLIGDMSLTDSQVKLLKDRFDDRKKAYDNENFKDVDVFHWSRIAEIVAFSYEIIGCHREATLAYKASTDILDLMISSFISRNQRITNHDSKEAVLRIEDFDNCKNALIYSKNLKRLTLGHLLKCLKGDDFVIFLIYFDTLIDLEQIDLCKTIINTLSKEKHPNKDYQDAIECLVNKFVHLNETC